MRSSRATGLALVAAGVLAGGNGVGVRYTNRELAPLWGAGLRFVLAALVLATVMGRRQHSLPKGNALRGAALFGLLNFAGAFGFAYYALVHMKAGAASALLALVPLATLLAAVLHREERLRLAAVVGGVAACAGVALVTQASLSDDVPVLAVLAALASVACFSEAAVLVRRMPPVAPVAMNTVAMGVGGGLLLMLSAIARESWSLPERRATWLALAYLVAFGSIVVFLLYLYVLAHWPASRAVYMDVLIPPVSVAASVWLDDEHLPAGLLLGGLLTVVGVYLGALRKADDADAADLRENVR